jgi:carboxylesterase
MSDASHLVDPRPIALGAGPKAVLLLHGLTGTPYELEPVATALFDRGFAVRAPVLAGHSDLVGLERSTRKDWYESAERVLAELVADRGRRVVVLGFSMGGLLAIRLSVLRPDSVAGLVLGSVPLRFPAWQKGAIAVLDRMRRTPALGRIVGVLRKSAPDVRIAREALTSPSLRGFPFPSLAELTKLQAEVDALVPRVRVPVLILHGALDHTARLADSERIAQRIGSTSVRRVVLPRSFHIIGRDLDRDRMSREVVEFVLSVLGDPHAPPGGEDER